MHKYIYQLSTSPIPLSEFITIDDVLDYYPSFIYEIAEYVDYIPAGEHSSAHAALYRSLAHANSKNPFSVNLTKLSPDTPEVLSLREGIREGYFSHRYAMFQKALKQLSCIDEVSFANDENGAVGYRMYDLRSAFNERFGTYIWIDDELLTLDEFVRSCKLNTPYYFGNILDYHF